MGENRIRIGVQTEIDKEEKNQKFVEG